MSKKVLFQNNSVSYANNPGLSGFGNDVNEGVLSISYSSSITGNTDYLVSYQDTRRWGYPSTDLQSVYSEQYSACWDSNYGTNTPVLKLL